MIRAFYYLWQHNHWYDLAAEQFITLARAGFPGTVDVHLGESTERAAQEIRQLAGACGLKADVRWRGDNPQESTAVIALKEYCDTVPGDHQVMYFHGKNVTLKGIFNTKWRWAMAHAVVAEWRERVEDLKSYDVVGFCLRKDPAYQWIFAGNYWWATSSWIRKLPSPPANGSRFDYERWLLSVEGWHAKTLISNDGEPFQDSYYLRHGNPHERLLHFLAAPREREFHT